MSSDGVSASPLSPGASELTDLVSASPTPSDPRVDHTSTFTSGLQMPTLAADAGARTEQALVLVASERALSSESKPVSPVGTGAVALENRAPRLPYSRLFMLFLKFGLRAWGGPVAQIAQLKQNLVIEQEWISVPRFQRVLAVYQVLPGPEATELCCYFGYLSRGRLGSLVAGLAFILPGFVLMLSAAVLYDSVGIKAAIVQSAFRTIQPAVAALVCRAVHKIGEHALQNSETKAFDTGLIVSAAVATIESVMGVNFFITLIHCALFYAVFFKRGWWVAGWVCVVLPFAAFIAVLILKGSFDDLIPKGVGAGNLGQTPGPIFLVGLVGGLITFGGAYTAIPVMQYETVTAGHWLTQQQFLDAIAVGQILPSPLVIFSTFLGYMAGSFGGAFLMTLGMFLPAFSFTIIGHSVFERIVDSPGVIMHALDGISAAVVGLIFVSALQITFSAVVRPIDAAVFCASFFVLVQFKNKFAPVVVVAAACIAGIIFHLQAERAGSGGAT